MKTYKERVLQLIRQPGDAFYHCRSIASTIAEEADAEIAQLKAEIAQLKAAQDAFVEVGFEIAAERDAAREERDALLKDAERMAWLAANTQWDGYGYWLPEICIQLREPEEGEPAFLTREDFNAAIDEAMASSSKEGK